MKESRSDWMRCAGCGMALPVRGSWELRVTWERRVGVNEVYDFHRQECLRSWLREVGITPMAEAS